MAPRPLRKKSPAKIPKATEPSDDQITLFGPPAASTKGGGMKDLEAAVRVLPLKSLSKRLYPVEDHHTHPPVFRLGYPVAEGWAKEYAQKKRIPSDFRSVIEYINSNCGAESFIVRFGRIHQLPCMEESNQYYWFLSICTNYRESDADLPSEQDMKRLQKFLNEPELPAWYLDRDERRWGKKKLWHRY